MFICKRLRMYGSAAIAAIVCVQCGAMESHALNMAELLNKVETGNFSDEVANKLFTTVNEWNRKKGEDIILEVLNSHFEKSGNEKSDKSAKKSTSMEIEEEAIIKDDVADLLKNRGNANILCARLFFKSSENRLVTQNVPYIFMSGMIVNDNIIKKMQKLPHLLEILRHISFLHQAMRPLHIQKGRFRCFCYPMK